MRYILLLLLTGSVFSLPLTAQSSDTQARRDRAAEMDLDRRMFNMRALEPQMRNLDRRNETKPASAPPGMSAEMKERILALRRVHPVDLAQYERFLKQPDTGMLKLFPKTDCLTENVVRVDDECNSFVPMSSDVSFRDIGYVDRNYRDLGFEGTDFSGTAFFSQGILVSLGDVPIEDVSVATPQVATLVAFSPDATPATARESSRSFAAGIEKSGFLYASHMTAEPDTTYALRVIAYKLGNDLPPPSLKLSLNELRFLSLGVDKRADILVVFRTVSRDMFGGMTIVWKEMSRQPAPTLRFGKNELMVDFAVVR